MAKNLSNKSQPRPPYNKTKKQEVVEKQSDIIERLTQRIADESPPSGYAPPLSQKMAFRALPLSEPTLRGLESSNTPFTIMTAIQNSCIPHALAGRDILGAAKTGRYVVPLWVLTEQLQNDGRYLLTSQVIE
jgi:superfamily II DNA/RNA helicase